MVGVFNIRGEGYEDGLEEDVDVCRDMFSGRAEVGNNGTARIVRFMDFGKEVEEWGSRFGIKEKGCHPWISLGRDQQ